MSKREFKHIKSSFLSLKRESYPHEHFIAGASPYTRGIYTTMYKKNPLEISLEKSSSLHFIAPKETTNLEELITDTLEKLEKHIEQELKQNKDIDFILSNLVVELPVLQQSFDTIVFAKTLRTLWAKKAMKFTAKKEVTALKTCLKMTEDYITQAMTAVFCGVQYLYIPQNGNFTKKEWEYFIKEELELMNVIDAWGGNSYIEKKVDFLLNKY